VDFEQQHPMLNTTLRNKVTDPWKVCIFVLVESLVVKIAIPQSPVTVTHTQLMPDLDIV
jgi:hypothetical protein